MLKAVPPMNFARTDPGESVTQPVLSPNSISETYKSAGAALGGLPKKRSILVHRIQAII